MCLYFSHVLALVAFSFFFAGYFIQRCFVFLSSPSRFVGEIRRVPLLLRFLQVVVVLGLGVLVPATVVVVVRPETQHRYVLVSRLSLLPSYHHSEQLVWHYITHLVLLVLGDQVVHVALGLREFHLVHA